jgi:hypothetical protein
MIRKTASDEIMEDLDMQYFPTLLLTKMMNFIPEDKVSELARWAAKNYAHQFIWGIFKEVSHETIIESYEFMAAKYPKLFTFEHEKHGLTHTMRIRHSRGPNWSRFYSETIRDSFWELVRIQVSMQWTQNEVVGTFTEPIKTHSRAKPGPIAALVQPIS